MCGAADALMLDMNGFVSETNATNLFMVKNGVVYTPTADSCLPGITRRTVIEIVARLHASSNSSSALISSPVIERNISLSEFHSADEVFTTGSMGELTPVVEIDGRPIGYPGQDDECGGSVNLSTLRPVTSLLQKMYRVLTETEGVPIAL
jgi:branched-subunit amino acid aminotransferase/4-amino-4-deoxychorismate lyase